MIVSNTMYPVHPFTFPKHENGRRKIISFHGPGTLFPGYHTNDFRIEQALTTAALSKIEVLESAAI